MGVPIDTEKSIVICGPAAEVVVDRNTGERKTNRDGLPLWRMWLVLFGDDEPKTMSVRTTFEPKGLVKGQAVRVTGLTQTSWTTPDGKALELYDALSIEPATRTPKDAP